MGPRRASGRTRVILCVDDDQSVLGLTKRVLEYEGYFVVTATNGQAALEKFAAGPVDAVVLDYEMPGMNGEQVALEMKRLNPRIPKLLFTSHQAIPQRAAQAIEAFCTKADGPRVMAARLHNLIDASTTSPPG